MEIKAVGIMSGSSLDGVDLALCSFRFKDGQLISWQFDDYHFFEFPEQLSERLKQATNLPVREYLFLENDFSQFIAEKSKDKIDQWNADLISIHGQTIWHIPSKNISTQMINPYLLAAHWSTPVIHNFRIADIVQGGQGAPMAPIADRDLFPGYDLYINVGGIINISYCKGDIWSAYDLIPGNQVLNFFAKKLGENYDKNGLFASQGSLNKELYRSLHTHNFIQKSSPKSLDNTQVMEEWIQPILAFDLSPNDVLHTFTNLIAKVIAEVVITDLSESARVFITGGGGHNTYLIEKLKEQLPNSSQIETVDTSLIDYKEAILMAYVGALKHLSIPNFISSVTGASTNVCGGEIILP